MVFHGGGSFGDVWPHHQKLREALLERYSGVKAIVFPQSIQFGDRRKYDEAAKLCGRHGNLTIFVRDQESLEFLAASGVPGEILPDMAHELWENAAFFPFPYTIGTGELQQTRIDLEGGAVKLAPKVVSIGMTPNLLATGYYTRYFVLGGASIPFRDQLPAIRHGMFCGIASSAMASNISRSLKVSGPTAYTV